VFERNFLFSVLNDILSLITKENINYNGFNVTEVFSAKLADSINPDYWNVVNKFSEQEKECILANICDKDSNIYSINVDKVKLFCAKSIFQKNDTNLKLYEFIPILNQTFNLVFPFELQNKITEDSVTYTLTPCEDNLYEYFNEFDLKFLKGYCFIYFLKTQRDALIR
jgi:hypothetical protein